MVGLKNLAMLGPLVRTQYVPGANVGMTVGLAMAGLATAAGEGEADGLATAAAPVAEGGCGPGARSGGRAATPNTRMKASRPTSGRRLRRLSGTGAGAGGAVTAATEAGRRVGGWTIR